MRTSVISKIVIVISIIYSVYLLMDRKITIATIVPANNIKLVKINRDPLRKTQKFKNMAFVPEVDPSSKKELTSEAVELNEDELNDFATNLKKLKKVNRFDQSDFLPSGEIIYTKRDYYETMERLENQKQLDEELSD